MSDRTRADGGLRVTCYAGYRGEQEPRQFFLGRRLVRIVEVLDRWAAPEYRYFKCLGSDGDTYILRHDATTHRWELTMYARGKTTLSSVHEMG